LDRESGQAISDCGIFTKAIGSISTLEKTVDQPIPSLETEDSPRSDSTGKSPLKKRGRKYFLTTWKRYYEDARA